MGLIRVDWGRFSKKGLLLNLWDWCGLWDLQSRAFPWRVSVHSRPSRLSRTQSQRWHTATMGPFFSSHTLTQPPPPTPLSLQQKQCVTPPSFSFSLPPCFFYCVFRWCGVSSVMQRAPSHPSDSISPETSLKPRCSSHTNTPVHPEPARLQSTSERNQRTHLHSHATAPRQQPCFSIH